MHCRSWIASPTEWADLLEHGEADYALSQTPRFGVAMSQAFEDYSWAPRVFEFDDGRKVLLPSLRVRRRPSWLRCFESAPIGLNGAPIVADKGLERRHVAALVGELRPDMLRVNTGATNGGPWGPEAADGLLEAVRCSSHVLDLEGGMERIWRERFTGKVRNQCRSAVRKGVEIRPASQKEEFGDYQGIYVSASRRWGYALPPHAPPLFSALASLLGQGVDLKLAWLAGRPIAGIILLHGRWSTLYWGAVMLKEFASYSPHNALLRTAIEEACEQGKSRFDFGSSGVLESVRDFKESFGARPVQYWNYLVTSPRYRVLERLRGFARHATRVR